MTSEQQPGCDVDRLWALAVGVLPPGEQEEAERHLAGCASCGPRSEAIRADVDALGCLAPGPAGQPGSPASPRSLAEQALERSRALQTRARRLRWWAIGAVALAAVSGGLLAAWILADYALARAELLRVEHAIQRVQNREGSYPADEEALARSLLELRDPQVPLDSQGRPLDHWGRPYRYRYPGQHVDGLFDLWSGGRNGRGEGDEPDDQTNWR